MQKIVLNLWYDTQAEEAAHFYVSLFHNSFLKRITRHGASSAAASSIPEGSVLSVEFVLDGQEYIAINGGSFFKLTPATSLMVSCDTQEEINRLWDAFMEKGQPLNCGWLTDRFGLSWQIVPTELNNMLADPDPAKVERVYDAMFQMQKLDLAALEAAYHG
ncbi:MAG: VOC family protein [Methanomicrobiales archaeon]|jgi:predicted 3-demethylubiquinone-9 3-methyltransferase (glyoxalase superfamily)|nr:VOC family protein [Methanomicrobiales archaeon]